MPRPAGAGGATASAQLAGDPFIESPARWGTRVVTDRAFAAAGLERSIQFEVTDYQRSALRSTPLR